MDEIEVKFLNISPGKIEQKLKALGAVKVFDRLFKRRVFDYPDLRLNSRGAFIRVRDEGDKIMLAYKERQCLGQNNGNDTGMKEIQFEVKDFTLACDFLLAVGLYEKFYEENRRICFRLNHTEFDIDFWPLLNPYLEIEAATRQEIDQAVSLLGLNPADQKVFTTFQIYELNGINELDYEILTLEKQIKKGGRRV